MPQLRYAQTRYLSVLLLSWLLVFFLTRTVLLLAHLADADAGLFDVLRLYGVPGQDRFDFIWPLISDGAMGMIILVDNSLAKPLETLDGYLDSFDEIVGTVPVVIAVTRLRDGIGPTVSAYVDHLARRGLDIAVVAMDPRERQDVLYLVNMIVAMIDVPAAA